MNIYNGNIYYLNYKDEANEDYTVCIFKISVDGGDAVNIKELSYYSSFINVVNGYIYLMDMNILRTSCLSAHFYPSYFYSILYLRSCQDH